MMKSWHSLTQQIELWRQKYRQQLSSFWVAGNPKQIKKPPTVLSNSPYRNKSYRRQKIQVRHSLAMLILAMIALTSVVGYRFYNQPQLAVGKVSPVRIEAPSDGRFEDNQTTLEKRKEVQTGIVPILKQDSQISDQIRQELVQYLSAIEDLRSLTKPFPFVDGKIISLSTQQYLRSTSEKELQSLLDVWNFQVESNSDSSLQSINQEKYSVLNLKQQQAVIQLQKYRTKVSDSEFNGLIAKIHNVRFRYAQGWKQLTVEAIDGFDEQDLAIFLDLSDRDWQNTKGAITLATERMITQGIAPGIPSDLLESAASLQLGSQIPDSVSHLCTNLLLTILQPNLQEDRDATRNIAEKAAQAIDPVTVAVEKGEVIVDQGEMISQADFVLLDGFGLSRRGINWFGLRLSSVLVMSVVGIFVIIQRRVYTSIRRRDYLLLCLLSISAPMLNMFNIAHTNLAAVGLLVSSFFNPLLALCHVMLLALLVAFSSPALGWEYLVAGSAGGLLTAAIAGKLRSREAMARLGVIVGLTQGGVYFVTKLILSASASSIWSAVLPGAIFHGLWGVAWCIFAIGISPYLERFFDLITPIRLAELSNPNLPLLKKLATEAPGTFQHTMFVASLGESAARKLNCNVELIRAGTLYHDIGKMHDPLGFIENQMGGPNKHDAIDDPWISAEIIKKHVSEGLVMAKKYGLPKAIRDFIPQHQGTLLIAYFYHQAQQKSKENSEIRVLESDFRYDGPIPQSREAGIMMLADACEAALRSLKDVTPDQALAIIKKIFKARWQDNQLEDSGLSYNELRTIAEVFVQVWQQFNHKRIAYPKGTLDPK